MPAFPSDFIALGKSSSSGGPGKRDGTSALGSGSSSSLASKKAKTSSAAALRGSGGGSGIAGIVTEFYPNRGAGNAWESVALDPDPPERLATSIMNAHKAGDRDTVVGLLCGAVKSLRMQRAKPDSTFYLSLLYLMKKSSDYWEYVSGNESVLEAFCSLLKRDVKESFKAKGNALISVLGANVLMTAFKNVPNWPELFVRVYIEDAMGERLWVDHPECKAFVDNVLTAFETRMPSQQQFAGSAYFSAKPSSGSGTPVGPSPSISGDGLSGSSSRDCGSPQGSRSGSGSATPTRPGNEEESPMDTLPINVVERMMGEGTTIPVIQRYAGRQDLIEQIVMEVVRDQLNRRQGTDNITRNFLRFLTSACGLPEVRVIVVPKLEMWIMNPKVSRPAQELMMAVAMNCTNQVPEDLEVIQNFLKLRFKNKPNINLFLNCLRELVNANREGNLPTLIKVTIFNELSAARNPNNMAMLGVMFSAGAQELAAASLAAVFVDLLMQKECYLRALRVLLREIVRVLRFDSSINLFIFCKNLMLDTKAESQMRDFEFRERFLTSVVDLVVLSIFLGISPSVRESINGHLRGEKKDLTPYKTFLRQVIEA